MSSSITESPKEVLFYLQYTPRIQQIVDILSQMIRSFIYIIARRLKIGNYTKIRLLLGQWNKDKFETNSE